MAIPQGTRSDSSEPGEFHIHRLSARLGAEQIEDVVRRYKAGGSARSLAAEFGVAPSALIRLLRERNVVVRRQTITPEQEEQMARDYETGMTVAKIKDKHGISYGAVLRTLHRMGVEMRAKAPRRKSE
jgi:transposase